MHDNVIPFPRATGSQPESVNDTAPARSGAARRSQPAGGTASITFTVRFEDGMPVAIEFIRPPAGNAPHDLPR